jgi:hypothetical protein
MDIPLYAIRSNPVDASLTGMVSENVPAATVWGVNVYTATEFLPAFVSLYKSIASNDVANVTVVYVILAEGVKNEVVPELLGAVPNVTTTPPALYPVPDTSVFVPV